MKKIQVFLQKKLTILIWLLFVLAIFALTTYLSQQSWQAFSTATEIIIVTFLIYLFFSYYNFKKEQNLAQQQALLEQKYNDLTAEFINYKNETKEYFLLLVHQIKTPITAADLILEKDDFDKMLLRQQLIQIEDYVNMSIAYLKLIETKADMDIYNLNLDDVIKAVLKKYSILFISKNIKLNYQPAEHNVLSDRRWLSLLIEQIVSNALKYTTNGYIAISYQDNHLAIKDSGIGIKAEDIEKIFDIGYSGFNGRLNQKSSGLGLYLAKKIAAKLNIKITVKSQLDEGSTFILTFL